MLRQQRHSFRVGNHPPGIPLTRSTSAEGSYNAALFKARPIPDRDDADVLSHCVFQADSSLSGNEYRRACLGVALVEVSGDNLRCPALSAEKNSMVLPRHIQVVDSQCRPVETGRQLGHGDGEDDLMDLDGAE